MRRVTTRQHLKHLNYLGAHVGIKVAKAFEIEARRRGKKRSWLVRHVLAAVAQDKLFEAVVVYDENKT